MTAPINSGIEHQVVRLSYAQVEALAEAWEELGARSDAANSQREITLEQTYTDTGGTHLYARRRGEGIVLHVSARGHVVELDGGWEQ